MSTAITHPNVIGRLRAVETPIFGWAQARAACSGKPAVVGQSFECVQQALGANERQWEADADEP